MHKNYCKNNNCELDQIVNEDKILLFIKEMEL